MSDTYRRDGLTKIDEFKREIHNDPRCPKLLCEGDSWFAFPYTTRRNVLRHLDNLSGGRAAILNLADNGDEARQMILGSQKQLLRLRLREFPFDAILFSGGGNDIVGPEFRNFLKLMLPGMAWEDCINKTTFGELIDQIEAAYLSLIALRDECLPDCPIITHTYDYAVPKNKKVKFTIIPLAGPWMLPALIAKKITRKADQKAIVVWMIDQFATRLKKLERQQANFICVDTRGTITREEDWGDEIHPTNAGFARIAARFLPRWHQKFPDYFPANA